MIKALLQIFAALVLFGAMADQTWAIDTELSQEFSKCMDKAIDHGFMITTERMKCLNAELKVKEKLLDQNYMDKFLKATPEQKRLLSQSQKKWVSYRNAWCLVEKSSPAAPGWRLNELFCLIDLTSGRTKNLKQLHLE
jgi:uncharacterized protein YecT (DUF1311 family)